MKCYLIVFIIGYNLMIAGCGQTGPLYLPNKAVAQNNNTVNS